MWNFPGAVFEMSRLSNRLSRLSRSRLGASAGGAIVWDIVGSFPFLEAMMLFATPELDALY